MSTTEPARRRTVQLQFELSVIDHQRLRRLCHERGEPARVVIAEALRLMEDRRRVEPSDAEKLIDEFFQAWRGLPSRIY